MHLALPVSARCDRRKSSRTPSSNRRQTVRGLQLTHAKTPPAGQINPPPVDGTQFFGLGQIDGKTEVLTMTLKDNTNAALYSVKLEPRRA